MSSPSARHIAPVSTGVIAALAVGPLALGLTALRAQPHGVHSTPAFVRSDSTAVPVMRIALGDSVDEVTRRSDIPLRAVNDPTRDPPFIVAGKPLTVEYTRPGATVRFPTGLFTAVGVQYGHAIDVTISPHQRALTLTDALALARELGALVEQSGWRRATTYLALEAVPGAVEAARHTVAGEAIGYEASLARWGGPGGDTLTLRIRRQASAADVRNENAILGKARPETDHYLISVEIENPALADRYFRLAYPQVGRAANRP